MLDNMNSNFLHLIGSAAIIIVLTFFINNHYYNLFSKNESDKKLRAYLVMGLFGGLFGVYANYAGIDYNGAIISIRDIGPMMAGVFGGPIGGLIAGGIACAHRLTLGGPTVYACSLATLTIGIMCGILHVIFGNKLIRIHWAMLIGVIMEDYHLLLVYLMVKPQDLAVSIIKSVAMPIVIANAVGFALMVAVSLYIDRQRTILFEKERISSELDVATKIQKSMLPIILPEFPGRKEFLMQASMTPAKEVGGDFYDIFYTDHDHIAIVMADVSGKGIPAALFMVIAKTLIKNNLQDGLSPAEAMTKTNAQLCENNEEGMFVTAWVGLMEIATGRITFVNAGHNPPLVTKNGHSEYLRTKSGFILAGMDMTRYNQYEMQLDDGDALFLYTDGVTEAENSAVELFGEDRLHDFISTCGEKTPDEIVKGVSAALDGFVGEAEQFDDITMLSLKMSGGYATKTIASDIAEIENVTSFAEDLLQEKNVAPKTIISFNISIDEILSNVIQYSGCSSIEVGVSVNGMRASLRFIDDGMEYDPNEAPEPDITESAEERKIGGLGLFMVKKMMDSLEYERKGEKNILIIRKNI